MNRRDFIQAGSLAALAAAGLPKGERKAGSGPYIYANKRADGKNKQTEYEITIYHAAVVTPGLATVDETLINLRASYYNKSEQTEASSVGVFGYIITLAEIKDEANKIYKVISKFKDKTSGDFEFSKDFPTDLAFNVKPFEYVDILSKKNKSLVSLAYVREVTPSSSGNCFLTTACVEQMKLSDSCHELQTLRNLRENYMRTSATGQLLAEEYKIIGPQIVNAINSYENREEIYSYMYHQMIQPSVRLVEEARHEEAVNHYKIFVEALWEKYV